MTGIPRDHARGLPRSPVLQSPSYRCRRFIDGAGSQSGYGRPLRDGSRRPWGERPSARMIGEPDARVAMPDTGAWMATVARARGGAAGGVSPDGVPDAGRGSGRAADTGGFRQAVRGGGS